VPVQEQVSQQCLLATLVYAGEELLVRQEAEIT
jgi:hypothetical protein